MQYLDVRSFFITDKIKIAEVELAFCPINDMLEEFFTKPFTGHLMRLYEREDTKSAWQHSYYCAHECVIEAQKRRNGHYESKCAKTEQKAGRMLMGLKEALQE